MTIEKLLSELRKINNKNLLVYYNNMMSTLRVTGVEKYNCAILLKFSSKDKPINIRCLVAQLLEYPSEYIIATIFGEITDIKVGSKLILKYWF